MRGLVPLWLLLLAVVVPGSVLIVQQWSLGERLALLQSHEQYGKVRGAVDALVGAMLDEFRAQNTRIYHGLLEPVRAVDAVTPRVPAAYLDLPAVRSQLGRPMALFTAAPAGDAFTLSYYTLDDEDKLQSFKEPRIEATHRALLTYIHSLAGREDAHHKDSDDPFSGHTEQSPLGAVHFFHAPLYGDDPLAPRAYAGCWETVDFAFRTFMEPYLQRGGLAEHLRAAALNPDAFQLAVLSQFGDRVFASTGDVAVDAVFEVRMSAYGPLFEPYTLRISTIRGRAANPAGAVRRQNFLLLALAGLLLGLGSVFLARSVNRDRWLAKTHTDFVARVSHELKTPVAVLLNAVETMKNPKVTDPVDQARCAAIVHDRVRDLARLLDRLLDVCRIDADRLPVARKRLDMRAYLDRAVPRLCEAVGLDPQQVRIEGDGDGPPGPVALADEAALDLILRNLLENVALHAGGGPVEVVCTSNTRWVSVSVRDHGPGVPRREHKRVFRRFYRAEDSMNASSPGHGLGLALVKALVEAHGGRVGVESDPGRGATFFFRLPREPQT